MIKCLLVTLAAVSLAMVMPVGTYAGGIGVVQDDPRPAEPPKRKCKKVNSVCSCKSGEDVCSQQYVPGDGWVCTSTDDEGSATNCSPL